jgi:hypothetical protein
MLIAAIKDFVPPLASAAIAAVATLLVARLVHRREADRLKFERERGTGRDAAARTELYAEYIQCLDRFYEPGERTRSAFSAWSTSYATTAAKMDVLGLDTVVTPVQNVSDILNRLRSEQLTGVDDSNFGNVWHQVAKSHQPELDQARQRVIQAMQADVGATTGDEASAGS